jgi:hypothetical protein
LTCVTPTITAGTFASVESTIYAATNGGNAITAAAGTVVQMLNSQIANPNGTPAKVALSGFSALANVTINRTASTLGTSLNTVADFNSIRTTGGLTLNGLLPATGSVMTINPSTGVVGYTGAPSNGTSGTSGVNGVTGAAGTSGSSGVNGANGTSGSSGTSGLTPVSQIGATGPTLIKSIWSGTQAEYDALGFTDYDILYCVTAE